MQKVQNNKSGLANWLPFGAKEFKHEREIKINRPANEIFAHLKLLKNFETWNPFLRHDPQVKTTYRGTDGTVGVVSAWDGNGRVGAGEQEFTKIMDGRIIEFELRFARPFKATNLGYWKLEPAGGSQTLVRWGMTGTRKFPLTIFCMFMNMDKMMNGEFDRGLGQLKAILEGQ